MLIMITNDEDINVTRGLPQGSQLSTILFNIYITKMLNEIIGDDIFA